MKKIIHILVHNWELLLSLQLYLVCDMKGIFWKFLW